MASELRVDTLKDSSGSNSVGMAYVAGGSAKSWINYTSVTTTSIRDSFNISSVTDVTTARTNPISFTSSMNNSTYSGYYYQSGSTGLAHTDFNNNYAGGLGDFTTSGFGTMSYAGSPVDAEMQFAGIDGDLA